MSVPLVLAIPLTSFLAGVVIPLLGEHRRRARTVVNLGSALAKLGLIAVLLWDVRAGAAPIFRLPLFMGFDLVLKADAFALLFVSLSGLLWLVTTVYAIGYLEAAKSRNRARFFCFFSFCVSASTGIALSGNLFTYFVFYELLTITTYPLVTHKGDDDSIRAGATYLRYTLGGGAVLLLAIVWLKSLVGAADFDPQGVVSGALVDHRVTLTVIFGMLIAGFGVKSAVLPFHGWLPAAMVAPAPVSALLHAVAVVKAGAFGIVRVIYDVFGVDVVTDLGVRPALIAVFSATILYGSVRALYQDDLKRRLAFSTISQLSYIGLGAAIAGPLATVGGIVHIVHQGLMKITMFFCAGNLAEELHLKRVSQLDGVGARMPVTLAAFTVAALGMIGVPPLAGFVSKWMLGLGALEAGQPWLLWILLGSSALNALYFLPIVHRAWFREASDPLPPSRRRWGLEVSWLLLGPPAFTAALVILVGVNAGAEWSPLWWAQLIAEREYGP